jgi:uncharacterized damage-inducible protein DinB
VNEVLFDAIRHNNWATRSLLTFCRDQNFTAEQLEVTGVGTFGGILATLHHIITCDGSYLRRLADSDLLPWAAGSKPRTGLRHPHRLRHRPPRHPSLGIRLVHSPNLGPAHRLGEVRRRRL